MSKVSESAKFFVTLSVYLHFWHPKNYPFREFLFSSPIWATKNNRIFYAGKSNVICCCPTRAGKQKCTKWIIFGMSKMEVNRQSDKKFCTLRYFGHISLHSCASLYFRTTNKKIGQQLSKNCIFFVFFKKKSYGWNPGSEKWHLKIVDFARAYLFNH